MQFLFPLDKCYLTQGYKETHLANDFGWVRVGVVDPPVYSIGDGVVIASYYSTGGGSIIAVLDKETSNAHWYQPRYVHLKVRYVKVGDIVKRGQILGIGNNTGTNSTGAHLHYELLIVPYGYAQFVYADRLKYAVDPRTIVFIKKGQEVTGEGVRYMELENSKTPIAVPYSDKLRMRSSPSAENLSNVVGYVPKEGLVYLAKTNEIEEMYWAKMLMNDDKIVWAAIERVDGTKVYMHIEEEHTIEYVEVPTVKPIDCLTIIDDAAVRVQVTPVPK